MTSVATDRSKPATWSPYRITYPSQSESGIVYAVRLAASAEHALERAIEEFGNQEFSVTPVESNRRSRLT